MSFEINGYRFQFYAYGVHTIPHFPLPLLYFNFKPPATPEYQTIIECTSSLITAVQNHLTDVSAQLLQRNLITANQEREVCNEINSAHSRAATLVGLVRNKVELNPKCYHTFIKALEHDQDTNEAILRQLKSKHHSLSVGEQIPFFFLCYMYNNINITTCM